jgi:hypothetical protein
MYASCGRRSRMLGAGFIAFVAAGCGAGGGEDASTALTFDLYFSSFGYDYEPAATVTELADRSTVVVLATLADITEGPRFGESWDTAVSRYALFMFDSPVLAAPIAVPFPYPIEIGDESLNASDVRAAMPIGARAVLYLVQQPAPNDPALWHGRDANTQYYDLTTPQGFVLERANEVDDRLGFPLEPDLAFNLGDRVGSGERLEDWLPPAGEKIPAQLRVSG